MLELAQPKFEAAGVADRIEVLVGSATDSIEKLLKQGVQFDIAFLDADKTGYLGYYKQLMDNQLISSGGIVVVDNALMKVSWLRRHLLCTSDNVGPARLSVANVHSHALLHCCLMYSASGALAAQNFKRNFGLDEDVLAWIGLCAFGLEQLT